MSPELQQRLFAAFPEIFAERLGEGSTLHTYGVSCRDGWYGLVQQLCHDVQQLVSRQQIAQPVAADVKEKFGKLKVHWRHPRRLDPRVLELTTQAEDRSCRVCDLCGALGRTLSNDGCWRTRCEVHSNDSGWSHHGEMTGTSVAPSPPPRLRPPMNSEG